MMQRRDNARDVVVTKPAAPLPAAQGRLSVSVLGAGIGGNLLEWYDFGIYGLLAPVLHSPGSQTERRARSSLHLACGKISRRGKHSDVQKKAYNLD